MADGRQGASSFDPSKLRAARAAAGLTQGALARAAHVSPSSIREWEAGRQVPRVQNVAALARALRISPQDLLNQQEGTVRTLQELRHATGKSQQEVATAAGLLRTTYSAIERGEIGTISYNDTRALARALRVSSADLVAAHDASRAAHLGQHPRAGNGGSHDES